MAKPRSSAQYSPRGPKQKVGSSFRKGSAQALVKSSSAFGEALFPKGWRAIVGQHAIAEALKIHPQWVKSLWLIEGWETRQDLKALRQEFQRKIPQIEIKPKAILDKLAQSHQGAAVFLDQSPEPDWAVIFAKKSSQVLLLDGLEDPHNLGAILRTGWLLGVDAVLLPQDRAVRLTPIVHKVASGGAEHVPIEIHGQFTNKLEELKQAGYWIFGLSHRGPGSLLNQKLPEKIVWCVGAEDKGLRSTTERLCDELVALPQVDAAASYNASVATAMALLETHRQHFLTVDAKSY